MITQIIVDHNNIHKLVFRKGKYYVHNYIIFNSNILKTQIYKANLKTSKIDLLLETKKEIDITKFPNITQHFLRSWKEKKLQFSKVEK